MKKLTSQIRLLWHSLAPPFGSAGFVVAAFAAIAAFRPLPLVAEHWSEMRGAEIRALISADPNVAHGLQMPGITSMPATRAKELVRRFDLK